MRRFKVFLWIFIVFLIQTAVISRLHIFGALPSLVTAYVICVAVLENEFHSAVIISLICAGVAGGLCGREFVITALFYAYSSIAVFSLRKKPIYVGNFPKALVWTFIMSAVMEVIFFAAENMTVNTRMIFLIALPTALFNTAFTAVIYPILNLSMYKEKKKKLLIV